MTENIAPSIPATAITTSARSISSSRPSSRTTPATPTSAITRDATPRYSSVRRASCATSMSAVPAVTIATSPGTGRFGFPTWTTSVRDFAS